MVVNADVLDKKVNKMTTDSNELANKTVKVLIIVNIICFVVVVLIYLIKVWFFGGF